MWTVINSPSSRIKWYAIFKKITLITNLKFLKKIKDPHLHPLSLSNASFIALLFLTFLSWSSALHTFLKGWRGEGLENNVSRTFLTPCSLSLLITHAFCLPHFESLAPTISLNISFSTRSKFQLFICTVLLTVTDCYNWVWSHLGSTLLLIFGQFSAFFQWLLMLIIRVFSFSVFL